MARVRIEVDFPVRLAEGAESAGSATVELEDPSLDENFPTLLERAREAVLQLLPQKEVEGRPKSKGQCQDRRPLGHPPRLCRLPEGHWGDHLDAEFRWPGRDRCGAYCPRGADHSGPRRCRLEAAHLGPHRGEGKHEGDYCSWSDPEPNPRPCGDRVHWLGKAYRCDRRMEHLGSHENVVSNFRWKIDGALEICGGEWGYDVTRPLSGGLACRLPRGHLGDCGPLPARLEEQEANEDGEINEANSEGVDCA